MTKISLLRFQLKVFDFAATYQVEQNNPSKVKLLALHHFQTGKEISAIADMVLATEKSVSRWIKRFIKFDYEELLVRKGRGRKPRLPINEESKFRDRLEELQDLREGGTIGALEIQKMLEMNLTVIIV